VTKQDSVTHRQQWHQAFLSSSSHMRVTNHNWSATKQQLHPHSVAEISCHSVLSGDRIQQCGTSSWVSPQGHRSVSVSCHFLLQAPQCPCSMRKRFSRDHCCRGRSKAVLWCNEQIHTYDISNMFAVITICIQQEMYLSSTTLSDIPVEKCLPWRSTVWMYWSICYISNIQQTSTVYWSDDV